jgi:hypothetical protein
MPEMLRMALSQSHDEEESLLQNGSNRYLCSTGADTAD